MSALRLARAATGRERIIKFAGAYHGHVDGLLAQAGSGLATQGIPASPGVPESWAAATVIVGWNDVEAVAAAVEQHRPAAIIAEPVPANMGVVPPAAGFLEALRELATESGALLIFDEVITGFRVARGGAQERYEVMPDLTVMGKIVGGGLPAAAYGGRRELMERIAPAGDVYQAGTLSGNPLAVSGRAGDPEPSRRRRVPAVGSRDEATRRRPARSRGECRPTPPHPERSGAADPVLHRRARVGLRRRRGRRPGGVRRLVPGAVGARGVPAGLAVRSLVSVARAQR